LIAAANVGPSTGLSAYSPDLPGRVATGATREEVEKEMREAFEFFGKKAENWGKSP